jgi:thiamine-phosphate pyrophosphorylase
MAIVDSRAAQQIGWTMTDLAAAFLSGGARLLQLRAKDAPGGPLLETAAAIVDRARRTHAQVVVNDRADIARLCGADGVHVGQQDLTPAAVRQIVGPDALVGLSTHTPEELDAALGQPVSYIAVGPVFPTTSKERAEASVGLEGVRRAAATAAAHGLPLVAIGGVTLDTAPDVLRAGAGSVAVIGDLVAGGDPESRVRAYLARLTI